MSRSLARALNFLIGAATAPQSPTRRAMTIARLMERLDMASTAVIQTARGPLKVLPQRGPHLAAAALDFDNEEPETLAWIDAIEEGEMLWDVGAATGLLSMYAALKPGVRIFAFEPKATSFGVLIEHLALNDMGERVFPLCLAFSDETGLTRLSLTAMSAGSGGNSVDGQPNQFGEFHSVFSQGAPAFRIDDFRTAFALPAPDHLKIDVDGVEGAILRGAPETLNQVKSVIIEVEGQNAEQAAIRIEAPLFAAGLVEDVTVRTSGSRRNRLYRRP
jgi:FkbM family methyltransferase